jgi:hypothetical protein
MDMHIKQKTKKTILFGEVKGMDMHIEDICIDSKTITKKLMIRSDFLNKTIAKFIIRIHIERNEMGPQATW